MANLSFIAQGHRGHLSQSLLGSGQTLTLDLFNSSYNGVKVYPSVLYIANAGNDGNVKIVFYDGTIRINPAKTNYHVSIDNVRTVMLNNTGHYDVLVYVLDKAAASESDITFSASGTTQQNDFLFHFDSVADFGVNYGIEPANFCSIVNSGCILNTTANKFGAGALEVPATVNSWTMTDRNFFIFGLKNYVIDFWFRHSLTAASTGAFLTITAASAALVYRMGFSNPGGALTTKALTNDIAVTAVGTGTILTQNVQTFIRVIISTTKIDVYVNGVRVLSGVILPGYIGAIGDILTIGPLGGSATGSVIIDELRIVRGLVLDNPETVPTQPYY